jgi:5-(carboxyamino)imidazole ribonucleotide mutase
MSMNAIIAYCRGSSMIQCRMQRRRGAPRPMVKSLPAGSDPLRSEGREMARQQKSVQVGVVMGSDSDWDVMQHAVAQLAAFGVAYEAKVVSAHRTPDAMFAYASGAAARGLACIIAGAGGAAHLPGMLAAKTTLPVLGVPIPTRHLNGEDSLLSIVQMPKGVPVATFAIGEAGAANAALFAVAMLARGNAALAKKLAKFRAAQTTATGALTLPPKLRAK